MICPICKRDTPDQYVEAHHLVPRHKGGAKGDRLDVCTSCGDQLHQLFENRELAKEYNTLEKIMSNERVQKWANWVGKKPNDFRICMRKKK
jgi:hypothetical protein